MKKISKYFCVNCLVVFSSAFGWGQQDSQFTQYMYNTIAINPAYAGSRGQLTFNALYRNQWVGVDGTPKTFTFSMNTPIGFKRVGVGLSFFRDEIGPSTEDQIASDFSYTIPVGRKTFFSFGLKGGINLLNVDFTQLDVQDSTDPVFASNIENRLTPNIGFGFYLRGKDKWYFGISTPNVLETEHLKNFARSEASERANYYAIGGYVFDIVPDVKFKPAFLVKAVSGSPVSFDFSANFLFNELFTLGAAYRLDAGVSALAAFQVSDKVLIGYAYDYDTSALRSFSSGSHEVFLRFELATRRRSVFNPRFF